MSALPTLPAADKRRQGRFPTSLPHATLVPLFEGRLACRRQALRRLPVFKFVGAALCLPGASKGGGPLRIFNRGLTYVRAPVILSASSARRIPTTASCLPTISPLPTHHFLFSSAGTPRTTPRPLLPPHSTTPLDSPSVYECFRPPFAKFPAAIPRLRFPQATQSAGTNPLPREPSFALSFEGLRVRARTKP